ncbi:MAG TPA: SpoIIIAH-like family protein [Clostridiales bacterium]|nr:SpoIIIAH-like family protein [Clostridiales bacterium]
MVLKRKSFVVGVLMFLLIMTGYLNFKYNNRVLDYEDDKNIVQDDKKPDILVKDLPSDVDKYNEEESNIETSSTTSFFKDFRYDRENTRKKEIEYINNIIDNPGFDENMKVEAQNQILQITNIMEKELSIEGLIKAKGFDDVIVILQENSVNVVVDKKELSAEEVAQILDIVKRETGQQAENIKIIPRS